MKMASTTYTGHLYIQFNLCLDTLELFAPVQDILVGESI